MARYAMTDTAMAITIQKIMDFNAVLVTGAKSSPLSACIISVQPFVVEVASPAIFSPS